MDVAFDPSDDAGTVEPNESAQQKRKIPHEVQKLFRCRRTVFAMLTKRGYDVRLPPDAVTVGAFVKKFGLVAHRGAFGMSVRHATNQNKVIHVVRGFFRD